MSESLDHIVQLKRKELCNSSNAKINKLAK